MCLNFNSEHNSLYKALIGSVMAFNVADFLVTAVASDFGMMVVGRFIFGSEIGLLSGRMQDSLPDAIRVSVLLGLFKLVITGTAVTVVDKLGRRPLLLGGVSGMVSPAPFLCLYFYIYLIRLYNYMISKSWQIRALKCWNCTLFSHLSVHLYKLC
ncbi:hypothetical protein Cgig2_033660 [Carnegiea gigantea]|uniref:Major facilitator superfamily (MFS) profile domain-containing protein n=1 Tax=Carnegiea gigantea TaxID=171969 RepID=A0A9Q1JY53_9CARY|nr:hypothetical protein Cgig2_033660 [Carnegiea gigantea]